MQPLPASSGDLTADRRLGFAEALAAGGDLAAAAEVLAGALELAPGWAAGWFRLGELRGAAGLAEAAAAAFAQALRLDPADRLGAAPQLALLGQGPPAALPPAFVETLFDAYADDFDAALVQRLGYRGPGALAALLPDRRFADALDLGCGTGLMGAALRDRCDRLEGWDISAGMLRRAAAKGLYDRLERADLTALAAPASSRDLIVAADVFNYLGPLEGIVGWVAGALRPGGSFTFSVEAFDGAGLVLGEGRRYRHAPGYLADVLGGAGFRGVAIHRAVLRHDRGAPVASLLVRAEAPA